MATGLITKRAVDALKASAADVFLWDTEIAGFGLKVTPMNARTYILQYRMGGRGCPTRRHTIGRHGVWTPEEARKEARRLRQMVDRGTDPQADLKQRLDADRERERTERTLGFPAYMERFLTEYGKAHWRPGTLANAASALRNYARPKLDKPLPQIVRSDITAMLDAVPRDKPALRRTVFVYTGKLFAWAVGRGDLDRSPMEGMTAPPAVASRERVLADSEVRLAWLGAAGASPAAFGSLVRLLILSGQRRDEVSEMTWDELDRGARLWTIPGSRTKNGQVQIVPLSGAMLAELDSLAGVSDKQEDKRQWPANGFVVTSNGKAAFSGFSKAKAKLDTAMLALARKEAADADADPEDISLAPWRLHDLRRTLATGMQRLGIRFEVTEAVLNHVSGSKAGVAGVYQRHDWLDEKRAALEAWAEHVQRAACGEKDSNVIRLRTRA